MKLTIVCPTYNEAENIKPLIETITTALKYVDHEIILADDNSEDRTWEVGERLRADYPHLRVLRRRSNRGLTPAVIDGFLAARGEFVACLDADLQHDPAAMVDMMTALDNGCDIAIGSRYVSGGSVGNWKWSRRMMSWLATKLATVFVGAKMSDPMSGYFMLRKTDFLSVNEDLNARGFKILVELVAKLSPKVIKEVPITFRPRIAGKSKLSTKVAFQYLHQLWRLSWIGNVLPVRFLKFGLVGSSGVIINLLVMVGVMNLLNWRNWRASMAATGCAIIFNYLINNAWTFRDRERTVVDAIRGLGLFAAVSMVGLLVTVCMYTGFTRGIGTVLDIQDPTAVLPTWVLLVCQFGAILFGTFFNYKLNLAITWKKMPYKDTDEPEL